MSLIIKPVFYEDSFNDSEDSEDDSEQKIITNFKFKIKTEDITTSFYISSNYLPATECNRLYNSLNSVAPHEILDNNDNVIISANMSGMCFKCFENSNEWKPYLNLYIPKNNCTAALIELKNYMIKYENKIEKEEEIRNMRHRNWRQQHGLPAEETSLEKQIIERKRKATWEVEDNNPILKAIKRDTTLIK